MIIRFCGVLFGVFGVATGVVADTVTCEEVVIAAEETAQTDVYDRCGFNDNNLAWDKWAGFASQKQMKRALYELCVRWPTHMYSDLYCEKSANLGYAPAMAEQGHRLMMKHLPQAAINLYTRALVAGGLTDEQEGQIAERLAMHYLDEKTPDYAPSKAIVYLQEAAQKRSALANNVLGYLTYTGQLGVNVNDEEAFKHFWRAILLGCPAAEENLGLFHLARLGQVKTQTALMHMKKTAFTCQGISQRTQQILKKPLECECEEALEQAQKYLSKPYVLIESDGKTAELKDLKGASLKVTPKQRLATGYTVAEIHRTAVVLEKTGERLILNQVTNLPCIAYCESISVNGKPGEEVQVKPYRLTFTSQECQDIMYYAPLLVDVSKPFTGKKECDGGATEDDPLLHLMRQSGMPQAITTEQKTTGVRGRIGVGGGEAISPAGSVATGTGRTVKQSKRVRPDLERRYVPTKEIKFTVGEGIAPKGQKK